MRSKPDAEALAWRRWVMAWVGLGLVWALLTAPAAEADAATKVIQGTVRVHPDFARDIAPGDRLIFKLFYPRGGQEMAPKFTIVSTFTLPLAFRLAPTIDMSGEPQWQAYMVEVFTDKDHNILSIVPGELIARTPALVPLGTTGVSLELKARGK